MRSFEEPKASNHRVMKSSEWGNTNWAKLREPKANTTQNPLKIETGLDASHNIYVSSEGRGRIFFLTSPLIG